MDTEDNGGPIPLTDDNGATRQLEHLDTVEINGELYMAFLPADIDEDDDDYGLVILKMTRSGDEDVLGTIDDDDELRMAHELFIERLSDDDSDDDNE